MTFSFKSLAAAVALLIEFDLPPKALRMPSSKLGIYSQIPLKSWKSPGTGAKPMSTRTSNIAIAQAFLGDESDQDLRQMVGDWLGQFPDTEAGLRQLKALKKSIILVNGSKGHDIKDKADRVFALIANDYGSLWSCDGRPPGRPVSSPSGKKRVPLTLRIDPDLKAKAQESGLQFAPLLEQAIQDALQ
jgi:hypothetical protein